MLLHFKFYFTVLRLSGREDYFSPNFACEIHTFFIKFYIIILVYLATIACCF